MDRYANSALTWLQRQLITYEAEPALAANFRAQQLHAVLRLTPLTLLANIYNSIVISHAFWSSASKVFLLCWSALVIGSACVGVPAWRRWKKGLLSSRSSTRVIGRTVRNAAILALLWAVLPIVLYPGSDAEQRMLLTAIISGMLCAGGFALATVPQAAIVYVIILSLGSAWSLGSTLLELTALLAIYSCIVISTVIATARTFGARLVAEAEADRQKQLVGLLLHDFEESASDWLWEVDRQGYLRHVSTRLAESFAAAPGDLLAQPFVDLIAASFPQLHDEQPDALQALRACLSAGAPFRDIVVPIQIAEQVRWWSLTAKPLLDSNGELLGWRGVGADITATQRANREMNRLANFDSLTGLANRHLFRVQLDRLTHDQSARDCALFFLDLDNFKLVNDSLGHGVGDKLLTIVAKRLGSRVQQGDLLARIGGDEFALICWNLQDPEAAGRTAQRLLDALREPCNVDGVIIQTGTSIGIALAPRDAQTPEALLNSADMALYAAKSQGRNTYRFFDRDIDERARRRSSIQLDLHQALERSEFYLNFQPQIDAHTHAVKGLEALLRWRHPSGKVIPPDDFIPIAEETGLIVPIGAWVLRSACAAAARWPAPLSVAVNLSAPQFATEGLVDLVEAALRESDLPAQRLELEVTESLLIHDSSDALKTLITLREMGVRVALDDFGTGYSSLAYLRTFPLDKLKIDRSFIASLEGDADAQAVVSAIVGLARALRLSTTAEGVENQAQLDLLTALGCNDIQGYFFSRPLPEQDVDNFLRQWAASAN